MLLGLAALLALAAAWAVEIAHSQSDEEQTGRIVAQRLADGRTEFGWQPAGGERVLPTQRYFPTDAEVGRWLNSSPVEVEGEAIGRINARLNDDGRIEFAFTPTGRERILTDARYFPAEPRPNRWLRSTQITIGPPQLDDPFIAVSGSPTPINQAGLWGGRQTCAIRESGEIECWGFEFLTQSGEADPPAGSFTAVSAGTYYTCAIAATFETSASSASESGEIECWGLSADDYRERVDYGQADPPAGRFTTVSAGYVHTCGLRESGAIECWGRNTWREWNEETEEWEEVIKGVTDAPAGSFSAVSVGGAYTCAIRAGSGAIECWGKNDDLGRLNAPAGSFTAVAAGSHHTCAIRAGSGAITCWGLNAPTHWNEETGEWKESDLRFTDAPAGSFTAVSAGGFHTCAIRTSGAIVCWGANEFDPQTDVSFYPPTS